MIVLATFAVCATVTMRTHAEKLSAEQRFEQVSTDVEKIKADNASLQNAVERLRTDKRAVENAARSRMNMVRANEIVIPLE
jgi:cell division protein FtsB